MVSVIVKINGDYIIRSVVKNDILYIAEHILTCILGVSTVFGEMIINKVFSRICTVQAAAE